MNRVVGIGACVLDTIIECGSYPKEDTKQAADKVIVRGGGPVANALAAISILGGSAEYLGVLSGDNDGDFLIDELEFYNVKCNVKREEARAFKSFIILSEKSYTRTCVFDRGTLSDDSKMIDLRAIEKANILHLDGNFLNCALAAAKRAKERGVKVSLDAGSVYLGIEKLLPYVDILIPSAEFALQMTKKSDIPSAIIELNRLYSPEILAVTDGSAGGFYLSGDAVEHYPPFVVKVKDSNGAGDVFHGAFISEHMRGSSVYECLRFASAVSAIKCMGVGVKESIPSREQVLVFLKDTI